MKRKRQSQAVGRVSCGSSRRGWLQNTCKRGRAPGLASDNHTSSSSGGRALVAAFLKEAAAPAAIATSSNKSSWRDQPGKDQQWEEKEAGSKG